MRSLLALVFVAGCAGSVPRYGNLPQPTPPDLATIDLSELTEGAINLLAEMVRIETGQPLGREQAAAERLIRHFAGSSIETELVPLSPGRASVFARLEGTTDAPPLLLVSHLDAYPAEAEAWVKEAGPFQGRSLAGRLHGRGVLDGKGTAALHAATLLALEKVGVTRDVILLATADGARSDGNGFASVLEAHPEIRTATLALTKGGYRYVDLFGEEVVHGVAVAEKGYAVLKVTAAGRPSKPAGVLLGNGLAKVFDRPRLPQLTPLMADFFKHLGDAHAWPKSMVLKSALLSRLTLLGVYAEDRSTAPYFTDVLEVVRLESGQAGARNAPDRAHAILTGILMPERTPAELRSEVRAEIGDPDVHVTIVAGDVATKTVWSPRVMGSIAESSAQTGEIVAPLLGVEPTDGRRLRRLGINVYGYVPLTVTRRDLGSIRGRNESVAHDNFGAALQAMTRLVFVLTR